MLPPFLVDNIAEKKCFYNVKKLKVLLIGNKMKWID